MNNLNERVILTIKVVKNERSGFLVAEGPNNGGECVSEKLDLAKEDQGGKIPLLHVLELLTHRHRSLHGLRCKAPLDKIPHLLGRGGEEDHAGHPFDERRLDGGEDRLILSNPDAVRWIEHRNTSTGNRRLREKLCGTQQGPIDKTLKVVAVKKRRELRAPAEILVSGELDGEEVGKVEGHR